MHFFQILLTSEKEVFTGGIKSVLTEIKKLIADKYLFLNRLGGGVDVIKRANFKMISWNP